MSVMHQVIEFYEQNLRLAQQTGDQRGEMAALNSLGRAYAALDERDKATRCFEQALQIARQISDVRGERQTLKNLDEVLRPPAAIDANDETGNQIRPSQRSGKKTQKKGSSAKAKSTRKKPVQQRKPKSPRASKKVRDTKD